MDYPVILSTANEGGFVVTLPDIPEAITQGESREDALEMALDALVTALDFYFEQRRSIPLPSAVEREHASVTLPPSVVAKVLLLNEMVAANVGCADLARRLGKSEQKVHRLLDLHHRTTIDTIAEALYVLGKKLKLQAE